LIKMVDHAQGWQGGKRPQRPRFSSALGERGARALDPQSLATRLLEFRRVGYAGFIARGEPGWALLHQEIETSGGDGRH
jgi:hypothetical protein